MIDYLGMVREFHETFGHIVADEPTLDQTKAVQKLRYDLIEEELSEFKDALVVGDLVEAADALADLLYVTFGAALVFGIPMDEIFSIVHASNMSKLDENGKPIYRADGKILKGPNFYEPQPLIKEALNV